MSKRLFRTYLAAGAVAIVAYFLMSYEVGIAVWDAVVLSMPITVLIGVHRFRPERRRPWFLLALGLGVFALGDVIWNLPTNAGGFGPADVAYGVGYPIIAIACLLLTRGDKRTSMLALVDASIGAIGLAVIVWIVVLSGGIAGSEPTFAAVVNATYPVFDILIVTLLVRLALADRSHGQAYWWLVGGFTVMMVTDLSYAWMLRASPEAYSSFLDLGWLVSYLAIGAAALHPTMVRLTRQDSSEGLLSPLDVLWLGIPLFAVPILMLLPGHDEPIDRFVLAAAAIALAALVMIRIVSSARERDRAHQEARTAEVEYRAVFESSPVAVLKVTTVGVILEANPAAERLFAFEEGLVGRTEAGLLVDPEADTPRIREAWTSLANMPSSAHATWTARVRRGDGSSFWSTANASIVRDLNGANSFSIIAMEDVTLQREEEEHLRFRALHDPLTGLPNRDLLAEGLRRSLARAKRQGSKVAVMFMDLDGFKAVNDRMGHAVGDELLRALAERLESAARGGDMVARLGGDEFVIVVDGVQNVEQAEVTTVRFLEEVRRPVVAGGSRIMLDASIGLVVTGADDVDPDEILRHADSAMYEAKRSGAGGWRRFEDRAAAGL